MGVLFMKEPGELKCLVMQQMNRRIKRRRRKRNRNRRKKRRKRQWRRKRELQRKVTREEGEGNA